MAVPATPAAELSGAQARRLVRRSTAQRVDTTLGQRLSDAWSTAASVAIGLAVLGGWLGTLRDDLVGRTRVGGALLPGGLTAGVALVVAAAGLLALLDRLGPVSSSPAATAWLLPLPADRRGLLRSELGKVTGACALVAGLLAVPAALAWSTEPSLSVAAAGAVGAGAVGGILVGAVALLQTRGVRGSVAPSAGGVAVLVAGAAALLSVTPPLLRRLPAAGPPAAATGWLGPSLAAATAVALLLVAERGLGRLDAGRLRALGATSGYATASVFSMDTRQPGRALAPAAVRPPRRPRRFRAVRRPWQAVVAADLALLARSRWQLGQLVVGAAVPVLVARTAGLGGMPAAVAAGIFLGWFLAAVAAGHPGRQAQVTPALDLLLPLSAAELVAARFLAPVAVLVPACGASGALIALGAGEPLWIPLALASVPAWAAAALRGAHRPEVDWTGPVVSTPMGVLPAGVVSTFFQGFDVALAGVVPIAAALVLGALPTAGLVLGELAWATALAAAVLTHLARRRPA